MNYYSYISYMIMVVFCYLLTKAVSIRSILFMTIIMGTVPHSLSTFSFHQGTFSNDFLSVVENASRQKFEPLE